MDKDNLLKMLCDIKDGKLLPVEVMREILALTPEISEDRAKIINKIEIDRIEYDIAQHEMSATQVFTQMKQIIQSITNQAFEISEDRIKKIAEIMCVICTNKDRCKMDGIRCDRPNRIASLSPEITRPCTDCGGSGKGRCDETCSDYGYDKGHGCMSETADCQAETDCPTCKGNKVVPVTPCACEFDNTGNIIKPCIGHKEWLQAKLSNPEKEIEGLREIMFDLIDNEECVYDHHGYCQTHNLGENPCANERANKALNNREGD